MKKLEIDLMRVVLGPSQILSQPALPVDIFDDNLLKLEAKMIQLMEATGGIGIAAPQVGVSKKMFIVGLPSDDEKVTYVTMINPHFIKKSKKKVFLDTLEQGEGCLSFPAVMVHVERHEHVEIEYYNVYGNKHTISLDGLAAVCAQHENDHIIGKTLLDYVLPRDMRGTMRSLNLAKDFLLKEEKQFYIDGQDFDKQNFVF